MAPYKYEQSMKYFDMINQNSPMIFRLIEGDDDEGN
jgi:hypothetical protein